MASAAVMTAVATKVAANWAHTPIIGPNLEGAVPVDGSAYLAITYPMANEDMKSQGAPGANVWREWGAFRIVLAVPIGIGLDVWAPRIDTLRTALRGKVFDGITTFEATPPVVGDETDDGAYFEVSTSVAYKFDVFG